MIHLRSTLRITSFVYLISSLFSVDLPLSASLITFHQHRSLLRAGLTGLRDLAQVQPELHAATSPDLGSLEQTRALVASLESGLQFARCIAGVMDVLKQLLASSSSDDVKHAITLLILARQFEIDGAEDSLRKMLPLVCPMVSLTS